MSAGDELRSRRDEPSDAELAQRIGRGDRDAAHMLIERYQPSVRAFLLRITGRHDLADDLAQETFVRVLRYASRYNPQHTMRTWLLTIARRLWINELRSKRRRSVPMIDNLTSQQPGPGEQVQHADEMQTTRKLLEEAIGTLTASQQTAVLLFHQQELCLAEAAKIMDMPIGTVKSHLHRGRAALRRVLAPQMEATRR